MPCLDSPAVRPVLPCPCSFMTSQFHVPTNAMPGVKLGEPSQRAQRHASFRLTMGMEMHGSMDAFSAQGGQLPGRVTPGLGHVLDFVPWQEQMMPCSVLESQHMHMTCCAGDGCCCALLRVGSVPSSAGWHRRRYAACMGRCTPYASWTRTPVSHSSCMRLHAASVSLLLASSLHAPQGR